MVAVGRTSHALFFDGVSDSVILPQGNYIGTGQPTPDGKVVTNLLQKERRSGGESPLIPKANGDFVIEAWVVPDCGGVIAHREGQFTLSLGTVDTPGPATFDLLLEGSAGLFQAYLTSAIDASDRWDGIVYPHHAGSVHDSYNRFDTGTYGEATNLNAAHRPLYHVVAGFSFGQAFLYVNGDLIASQKLDADMRIARSTEHVYVGGKGGEFRGAVEALHFLGHYDKSTVESHMPTQSDVSTGLYRFEEPIDVVEGTYSFNAVSANATSITVSASDAQALIVRFTGKPYDSASPTVDFTAKPYSMGSYKVVDYYTGSGTPSTLSIAHVPYNLLINPGAITRATQKPNQKPPERVRVKSINGSTGVIELTSIHVDFVNGTGGLRGLLHNRTADVDNYFVVVGADLLIDNGTGKPYQPPHYGTQVFDRTGQMVIDETDNEQHGMVYSSRMATTTDDPNNPFAVVWPSDVDPLFQIGHSGRHTFSHVVGHEFMRRYPVPSDLVVDQTVTGAADIVTMRYDNVSRSLRNSFAMNALTDVFSEDATATVTEIVSSTTASSVVHNGLPSAAREVIGIGGADFDFRPFLLKGPAPLSGSDVNDTTRLYHLVPETTSRVAILNVPALQTSHNMAPFVEIHYNAIDLTGASMGISGPMLMVEKTVPAASLDLGGGTYVYDLIAAALDATMYAPGGMLILDPDVKSSNEYMFESHSLIGDNTGGADYDSELDFTRTPAEYTPVSSVDAEPCTPPAPVRASHVSLDHESVYNRLTFTKAGIVTEDDLTEIGGYKRVTPTEEKTGAGVFDVGIPDGISPVHETFDVIDNYLAPSGKLHIFVQPTDRRRSNQLLSALEDDSSITIMLMMARTRLRSISEENDPESNLTTITVTGAGVVESVLNRNVSAVGEGSPDSYIVKEIEPNAPVVTVTLGGPGQGAVNTKPTFDPSPLMRLPGSTRRSCAVRATHVYAKNDTVTTKNILSVAPLNNGSPDIASWGTIAFPKVGRVYLDNGASAEYASKGGSGFIFTNVSASGTGRYLGADGEEYSNFFLWCNAVGLMKTTSSPADVQTSLTLYNDPNFADDAMAQDGSTVNDRLFQSMDTVTHDYQLGTQFASTRAMVEIPVFPQQFFDHPEQGIFPGPDNSMKLHLDATYTAHSWNPTPVGRRANDIGQADKQASSAYGSNREGFVAAAHIERIVKNPIPSPGFYEIYVDFPEIFPNADEGSLPRSVGNMKSVGYYRRCFLANGMSALYVNDPTTDGFIKVPVPSSKNHGTFIEGFFTNAIPGAALFVAQGFRSETLVPTDSDASTPSSDFEGRSPYYYDAANVQTQGGNLDYGMRQYVSAVEFKAGPLANPHAPRTVSKRAASTILSVPSVSGNTYTITLEDGSLFPDVPFTRDASNVIQFETGDPLYIAEVIQADGSTQDVYYLGRFNNTFTQNTIAIVATSTPTLVGATLRLKHVAHALHTLSNPASAVTEEKKVVTFLPSATADQWTFSSSYGGGTTTTLNITCTTADLMAHANVVGLNIRPDDHVYVDTGSAINYLGQVSKVESAEVSGGSDRIILAANNLAAITSGNKIRVAAESVMTVDDEAILNRAWVHPYATGGLRHGDTVWANMSINNPHATEGLFAKSRGVFNDGLVWKGFNGGSGTLADRPRNSIPLENFLIGDSCLETAINYAQHVNKTVQMNYESMGLDAEQAPVVAYVDPYLATDGHARVLLYDVGHDREFIAFHDLHMQVQSSAATPSIGYTRQLAYKDGTINLDKFLMGRNGAAPHYLTTQIDVANGYPSENPFLRATQQSKFIEGAYAHNVIGGVNQNPYNASSEQSWTVLNNPDVDTYNVLFASKGHGHFVHTGLYHEKGSSDLTVGDSTLPRTQPAVASPYWSNAIHQLSRINADSHPLITALRVHRAEQNPNTHTLKDPSTLFDTPDGTRTISAFLSLKGKRSIALDLSGHDEERLQHLPHWTQMDFVRRMTVDFGEIGVKEGVTDIEAAAREIVRLINQGGAANGRTHARRPSQQYPGESERLDLTRIGVRQDIGNPNRDPTSAHIFADFAATGSTYDPAPWWYPDEAFDSHDRGSHMGYLRAHIGRVVEDLDGNEGFSIVIHSTIPGASGRNFCAWLDNSKGQSSYKPQYLIGHGGRFRNFWSQPDEVSGENMHPAPLPLNKHGRPFAPITSLREYVAQEEPDDMFASNLDVAARNDVEKNALARKVSATMGGTVNNSVADESFEAQSPATSLVEGLRRGSTAVGRINFGGLVEAGVPGFAPDAGAFGFGRRGSTRHFSRYGTNASEYTSHVNTEEVTEDAIGDTPLYGMRFTDHRGRGYGVRYVYRCVNQPFANELTTLPSTLDDEIIIHFDDRDVAQGGFTIGHHMAGVGDATGRLEPKSGMTEATWVGNRWRGVFAADAGLNCQATYSSDTITVVLDTPYDTGSTEFNNHPDILGYLGFPKTNGIMQLTDPYSGSATTLHGVVGNTFSYESRTSNDTTGTHTFYGVRGADFTATHTSASFVVTDVPSGVSFKAGNTHQLILSPRLNWTTLLTDEVIAYATVAAINMQDPNMEDGYSVDVRHLYAADGRTLGDWGVGEDAIIIRAHNPQRGIKPLSQMFSASLHRDYGIQAAHIEFGEYQKIAKTSATWSVTAGLIPPLSDAQIASSKQLTCGYIPRTIVQVRTRGRGYHANTPTPILVDSYNDPVNLKRWDENLKGVRFLSRPGDHILPCLSNPLLKTQSVSSNVFTMAATNKLGHAMIVGCTRTITGTYTTTDRLLAFGQKIQLYHARNNYSVVFANQGANALTEFTFNEREASDEWFDEFGGKTLNQDYYFISSIGEFDGYRLHGSVDSEPIVYFRGARDSSDHDVPLYFGGGFSGVVLDVNDGTQNDYADFYTHPYSTGPTGTAGIQNANEISTSFALVDCNALLAFFPGTALLNQHRGSIHPPAYNKDSILTTDVDVGFATKHNDLPAHVTARYTAGMVYQRPIPLVLRMGHPTARYDDARNSITNHTTYVIYGPGQAFPFTETTAANADVEPHPGFVVTVGNTWSKVPHSKQLPNPITNDKNDYGPPTSTYQSNRQRYHWYSTWNWSPAEGIPRVGAVSSGVSLWQRPEHGYHFGEHFNLQATVSSLNISDYAAAHPYKHAPIVGYGIASQADLTFHMDGGYHPGGSWLDNQLSFNAPLEPSDYRVTRDSWNEVNPTAFRVSGVLAKQVLAGASAEEGDDFDREIIVVDATRCQNGEELAALLGQAINENPGKGALKAMGGTHLPSMGSAMRQDRYGWVELDYDDYTIDATKSYSYVEATLSGGTQAILEQLPASGWIRTDNAGRTLHTVDLPAFAPYHSREVYYDIGVFPSTWKVRFWLAPNRLTGNPELEDAQTFDDSTLPTAVDLSGVTKVYVWSKAGVHRFNNEDDATRDHMTQVHFAGIVDAIDRTRPVGAVGWSGERYSYLNSLKVGSEGYGAGRGAWHPKLGFSPYGSASTVMTAYGHVPHTYALYNTPESLVYANYDGVGTPYDSWTVETGSISYTAYNADSTGAYKAADSAINLTNSLTDFSIPRELYHPQGVFSKGFLVVSYESELALVAKRDRDGITATGDWLAVVSKTRAGTAAATAITFAGTAQWDERIHGPERFYAPATGGPNVEALIVSGTATPASAATNDPEVAQYDFHLGASSDNSLYNATPAFAQIGDLFFDLDKSVGSYLLNDASEVERNLMVDMRTAGGGTDFNAKHDDLRYWLAQTNGYESLARTPMRNFSVEHVVWKRMDGGNLSLPALNARGLGGVPFVTRVSGGTAYTTGEKLYGNVRFSFETTNSAMFPIIQAQELAHPQIAARHPDELRNVLMVPNEEIQFDSIEVEDDTGQIHTIEGGSPFGTIVRAFRKLSNRTSEGLAPAIAGSGVEPNLKVRLPDPNTIPGNIIVRSGFDRLQAYQTETMGSGGMMRPGLADALKHQFTDEVDGPRRGPTYSDHEWDHISQSASGEAFPDMTRKGWSAATGNAPLESSYELHDRTLFFHVTKCGNTHTHRYPTHYTHANGVQNNDLSATGFSSGTLTVDATIDAALYPTTFGNQEAADNRRFLRLYDAATDRGGVASFTGISGDTFTGCVGDAEFDALVANGVSGLKVVPSYYMPAGSTRFYAARRLRDHAEVSGNSPDMAHTLYYTNVDANTTAHSIFTKPVLTPMALPRMGHHYVTPTMAMLPGHWAHPAYQGLYDKHRAIRASSHKYVEQSLMESLGFNEVKSDITTTTTDQFFGLDPQLRIGTLTATPGGPSDIHGGAFTLMFETKVRHDGYGVLASEGAAGTINSQGGQTIILEAAATYSLKHHFPDPAEVGAYQIVIQPNLNKSQFIGYHENAANELTSQQVALVVGIREVDGTTGALGLVLAQTTEADVRGCEVFINEVMIDHDPDHGSQFTNIPPLLLYNSFGVQETEAPAFTRMSLPYHPGMFADATPGLTTNIPWWSIVHRRPPNHADSEGFRHLTWHRFDNYYEFARANAGNVASQITLAGYPSSAPDMYSKLFNLISLNPVATVVSASTFAVVVDDARGFPEYPYYGQKLEYTDANGVRRTTEYTDVIAGSTQVIINHPANADFTNNLTAGTKLRLTRAYDFRPSGAIFTDSKTSIITRMLPQTLQGSRDTNSLHLADAFLCMWHPNLGRPYTFYSDSARTFLNPLTDRAVDNKPYNSMPEHFETIHYHDAPYFGSVGPFGLAIKTPPPLVKATFDGNPAAVTSVTPSTKRIAFQVGPHVGTNIVTGEVISIAGRAYTVASVSLIGSITVDQTPDAEIPVGTIAYRGGNNAVQTAESITSSGEYVAQGGQTDSGDDSTKVMLNNMWPSGSRGGPLVSSLDGYGAVAASWTYAGDYGYERRVWQQDGTGVTTSTYDSLSNPTTPLPFGYRFGLRQPYNKPQWSFYGMRAYRAGVTVGYYTADYQHGPLVQRETQSWVHHNALPPVTYPETYVGIMERQTNFSGMLGVDMAERQVRYSDGMRMTRSFGAPVRTLRNKSTVIRDWWGDDNGKDIANIDEAVMYYLVDWWGNTRGEDVRRFPVRGFGIRPAWDAGDAYDPGRSTDATPYERLYNDGSPLVNLKGIVDSASSNISLAPGVTIPRFGGRQNTTNNNNANTLIDVFMPANAMRVGDMGNGRGIRYPTQFNEDRLTALDEANYTTGVVLSHHTAEPVFGDGFIRPRNDELASDEVPRGISARLSVDEDGLLKPEAVVSPRVETISGSTKHTDAVSRSAPRIGLDTENVEGVDDNLIALNTEAHSLHADRGVGQRVVLVGGMTAGSQTIGNLDYTGLNFGAQPVGGVARFSHTSNFNPLGGTYVAETRNYLAAVSDYGWGPVGADKASNPYATSTFDSTSAQMNHTDKTISFLFRPVRLLDEQHVEMFRPNNNLHSSSPQYGSNYFSTTGGGKYGVYAYEMPSARASAGEYIRATNPDTNPPYAPVYHMVIATSDTVPDSKGPNLGGSNGMDTSKLDNDVTRLVISENSLQHHRSDAARRRTSAESDDTERRADYTVKARFSQSLHPKGHKGDVDYGESDHSGDAS